MGDLVVVTLCSCVHVNQVFVYVHINPMFVLVNTCFVTSGTISCRGNFLFNLPCNGPARLGTLGPASTTEREREAGRGKERERGVGRGKEREGGERERGRGGGGGGREGEREREGG